MDAKEKLEELRKMLFGSNEKTELSEVKEVEKEVKEEVALEEVKEEVSVEPKEVVENYVTMSAFDAFKTEMLSMFKTLMEENKKEVQEVPQKLSSEKEVKEDVELSESVEEIVHSPENIEKKEFHFDAFNASIQERIYHKLNS
ncbi:MAG: hypothetical protein HRU18_11105 [Pseudoalteromonas sp.]|uniref:hypothetical protein n=1 Tax=Pseudoalteromonas sp. TaxID=53249 RepID=UPI001DB8432D|nr:hypothetical protein [Pseudoalteromonas sp.]NRA78747.1 hypothetical protein [Pseudoalteromonas sp.]